MDEYDRKWGADAVSLTDPLRWRKAGRVRIAGDLFHGDVPDEWIDRAFAVMALAPQRTFQVLTKRSARMRRYCADPATPRRIYEIACDMALDLQLHVVLIAQGADWRLAPAGPRIYLDVWPLPNVWLGVSTEDQLRANERVPDLLATPAAARFVSAEPLIGAINYRLIRIAPDHHTILDALGGYVVGDSISGSGQDRTRLDWVIVGGESGPGSRPMHPDWARSIRDQCAAAGVPFMFKQWGGWAPRRPAAQNDLVDTRKSLIVGRDGRHTSGLMPYDETAWVMDRVGKRAAGRLLDGVEHNGSPEARR